jgi:hypothetical protein
MKSLLRRQGPFDPLWISGVVFMALTVALSSQGVAAGQGRGGAGGRGGAPAAPRTARAVAPVDFTGMWVAIVSEDWRWRMVTPRKGDYASVPGMTADARKIADSWDLAADNAAGNQCKAFGAGGIMRQPGRIRISWQDEQTLKLEFDAGTQTRLLQFDPASRPQQTASPAEKTWQGFSAATWEGPGVGRGAAPVGDARVAGGGTLAVPGGGGQGLRGAPPPRGRASINSGGNIKVITTGFREGYLRKNGVPYSEAATITEYIHRLPAHPNGDVYLNVITIVEDPRYLSQPFYTSTNFKLEPDASKFAPTPCMTPPALPVTVKPAK